MARDPGQFHVKMSQRRFEIGTPFADVDVFKRHITRVVQLFEDQLVGVGSPDQRLIRMQITPTAGNAMSDGRIS